MKPDPRATPYPFPFLWHRTLAEADEYQRLKTAFSEQVEGMPHDQFQRFMALGRKGKPAANV